MHRSTYDDVPYPSLPYPRTHPDRLHAIGRLFGVRSAAPARARVLEVGCGSGGNLLGIAASLPEATCVGVDPSRGEMDRARELANAAGLRNVELFAVDHHGAPSGPFDFVIVHGVTSWVAPEVRREMWSAIRARLAENGLVYASYNVHPGWKLRSVMREALRWRAGDGDPGTRLARAKELVAFLDARVARDGSAYRHVLDEEIARLRGADEAYLFHEHLEDENHAFWFHELEAEARAHGLFFVSEADPPAILHRAITPRAIEALAKLDDDRLAIEQAFDLLRGRTFRASIFTARALSADATRVLPADLGDLEAFLRDGEGVEASFVSPLAAAAPDGVPLSQLGDARDVLPLFAAGAIDLGARTLGLARAEGGPEERLVATGLARAQALRSGPVTNLRHEPIPLSETERQALFLCDGTRPRAALPADIGTLARLAFLRVAH